MVGSALNRIGAKGEYSPFAQARRSVLRHGTLSKLANQVDLIVSVALVLLVALLAFLGSSLAARFLPYAMVSFAGFVFGYIAVTDNFAYWAQRVAGFLAVLSLIGFCLVTFWSVSGVGWADRVYDFEGGPASYAFAFMLGCVTALVRKSLFPHTFPGTAEVAREQGRIERRNVLIVVALLLVICMLIVLLVGFLALVAYATAWLSG